LTLRAEIAREEREKARLETEKARVETQKAKWEYELKKLDVQEASQRPPAPTKSSASVKKSDAINFETQSMMHAVDCLVRSELYDKDSRTLVPPQDQGHDAAFLRTVYAAVADQHADEDVSNALEVIAATLYNPSKPSSLYDVWRKAFPLLDPRRILPDHEKPLESQKVCHHEEFKHGAPVLLLWQDVDSNGALVEAPRVVAVGRVLCRAQGAIKCTCEPPGVRIKVIRVREDSEEARNQVSTFMLGEEAEDIEAGGLTPFSTAKNVNGEVEYQYLRSSSTKDLRSGQHWQWPLKLIRHDLDKEAELAEQVEKEAAKRAKAEAERKKREKAARRAEKTAANREEERRKRQTGDVTTGRETVQAANKQRRCERQTSK